MVTVIVAAAGNGRRMGSEKNKILLDLNGKPVLQYSLELFSQLKDVSEIIVVASDCDMSEVGELCARCITEKSFCVVKGGSERQDSIMNALRRVSDASKYVLVHDGARPFVTKKIVKQLIEATIKHQAAILAVPVKDTIKATENSFVANTPPRSSLVAVQTPQGFEVNLLKWSYSQALDKGYYGTDDASLVEYCGSKVVVVEGDYDNIKLTTPEDILIGKQILARTHGFNNSCNVSRTGFGYDVHRLVPGRKLILGGVDIAHETGLLGHSDADVLLHAIMDALLGAAGLGDLGQHFPDNDDKYKGISSGRLLEHVCGLLTERCFTIVNIDATVVAERPKIAQYTAQMAQIIAKSCSVESSVINIKATTTEGLGFAGKKEGIAAYAVVSIMQKQ